MALSKAELKSRLIVETINENLDVKGGSQSTIYNEAIQMVSDELISKLNNLQLGETIQITFRIDIIGSNGKVRGGSGSQRNMSEYIEWRKAVFERDSYTCQECGAKGRLNAHHVKQWSYHPDLRFDVSNGITLCEECHSKKHPHLKIINGKTNRPNT